MSSHAGSSHLSRQCNHGLYPGRLKQEEQIHARDVRLVVVTPSFKEGTKQKVDVWE
jgi:hypothetical protein